jgi:UDP-glucose 4-epimerase
MSQKKVAVTGGAGFLGSHVVRRLLEKGHAVTVIDNFSNGKRFHLDAVSDDPNLEIMEGDIRSIEQVRMAFKGADTIIHLAVLCLRQSLEDPFLVNEAIVDGTLNCLQVARDQNVELFLNCSSSEVYGTAEMTPMPETHPFNPKTPYAAGKVAQDMYVHSYGATYGLPWTTIRPFNMYGPNSHWQGHRGELIPRMVVRAMNKKPLPVFGDGAQTRDFMYVEDAAKAVVAVAEEPSCQGKTMNFCTGQETPVMKIAEIICRLFDLDPTRYIIKYPSRPGDVIRHCGDNSLFREVVGFTPAVSLEEGIQRTLEWFRSLPCTPEELISDELAHIQQ